MGDAFGGFNTLTIVLVIAVVIGYFVIAGMGKRRK